MKRCPKCDFTFADFHRVCDFDGTSLLDDPERPPSFVKYRSPQTRFRRVLKSPLFLDGVAVAALLATAFLIRYYHSPTGAESMAANQPSQEAFVSPVSPAQHATPPAQRQPQTKAPAAATRAAVQHNSKRTEQSSSPARREGTASRQLARVYSPIPVTNRAPESTAARQTEREDPANRKDPKLIAMLKTTWRVLKKPFKF